MSQQWQLVKTGAFIEISQDCAQVRHTTYNYFPVHANIHYTHCSPPHIAPKLYSKLWFISDSFRGFHEGYKMLVLPNSLELDSKSQTLESLFIAVL